jgi:transposase-like protein
VNVYPFIEAERAQQRSVKRTCELLEVSRAAYYAHHAGAVPARQRTDEELTERIRQAERDSGNRSDSGLTSAERYELAALRRENQRLRGDVEVLKRATAFFAKETR